MPARPKLSSNCLRQTKEETVSISLTVSDGKSEQTKDIKALRKNIPAHEPGCYEASDPDLGGQRYRDNTFKGKDRYNTSADLDAATQNWWDYFFVVYPPTEWQADKVMEGRGDIHYGK
jgi:hypothetical protein